MNRIYLDNSQFSVDFIKLKDYPDVTVEDVESLEIYVFSDDIISELDTDEMISEIVDRNEAAEFLESLDDRDIEEEYDRRKSINRYKNPELMNLYDDTLIADNFFEAVITFVKIHGFQKGLCILENNIQ